MRNSYAMSRAEAVAILDSVRLPPGSDPKLLQELRAKLEKTATKTPTVKAPDLSKKSK